MPEQRQTIDSIKAAILAGGLGTRLRPKVADRPKVLAEVCGRPFLQFLLDQLCVAGIKDVVFCTGYMGNQVHALFGNCYRGIRLAYSKEPSPLGTAGALRLALPLLESHDILVMNGDSYCEANLHDFWSWHHNGDAEATLLLARVADTARYGRVQVDHAGRVLSFEEKGHKSGPGWINAGVYLIRHRLIESIPSMGPASIERDVFPGWIGRSLYGFQSEGRFLDIGTPEAYAEAQDFFAVDEQAYRTVDCSLSENWL